jgi:hypothetical protein
MLTQERLKQCLSYDPETGEFRALMTVGARQAGSVAGSKHPKGYIAITVDGHRQLAHRLAWLYVYGVFPQGDTDHIDGVKTNNRIANLREATRSQNMANLGALKSSKSGIRGVRFYARTGRWVSCIKANGKSVHLGYFATAEGAAQAYREAAIRLHGEFARAS